VSYSSYRLVCLKSASFLIRDSKRTTFNILKEGSQFILSWIKDKQKNIKWYKYQRYFLKIISSLLKLPAVITEIEQYIIERVKEMRLELGISQLVLSQKLDMNETFIAHVESPKRRAKYNVNHINAIARIFNCSPKDFLPADPL
jgi:DNA-binding XRE family transcriptional regulator